jgi:hypothetical protein
MSTLSPSLTLFVKLSHVFDIPIIIYLENKSAICYMRKDVIF